MRSWKTVDGTFYIDLCMLNFINYVQRGYWITVYINNIFLSNPHASRPCSEENFRHLYFLLKKSTFLDKFPLFTTQWNENGNWSSVHLKIPFNLFRWQNIERNKLKVIAELKTAGNSHLKLHINFRSHMNFRCPVFRSYFEMFAQILMVAFSNSVLS